MCERRENTFTQTNNRTHEFFIRRTVYNFIRSKLQLRCMRQKEWVEAKTIGITLSMEHEVNTYPIIEKAWEEGKKDCCSEV